MEKLFFYIAAVEYIKLISIHLLQILFLYLIEIILKPSYS